MLTVGQRIIDQRMPTVFMLPSLSFSSPSLPQLNECWGIEKEEEEDQVLTLHPLSMHAQPEGMRMEVDRGVHGVSFSSSFLFGLAQER